MLSARRRPFLRKKIAKREARLGLELLPILLIGVALLILAKRLDRELYLSSTRIDLDTFGLDVLADVEGLSKFRASRRSSSRRGHVPARIATRHAENAHDETATFDRQDLGLDGLVRNTRCGASPAASP